MAEGREDAIVRIAVRFVGPGKHETLWNRSRNLEQATLARADAYTRRKPINTSYLLYLHIYDLVCTLLYKLGDAIVDRYYL